MADETPPLASVVGPMLKSLADAFGLTPEGIATLAGTFVGNVLRPIVREEIDAALKAFKDTAEVAKPNAELEDDWNRLPPVGTGGL